MIPAVLLLILLGLVWFSLRYAWWRPAVDYRYPRILMYHMIATPRPGARFNGLRVAPQSFERQLRWLSDQGWHSFTVGELVAQADIDGGLIGGASLKADDFLAVCSAANR